MNKTINDLNSDQELRDAILGITSSQYSGGIAHFNNLKFSQLNQLSKHRFLNFKDRQNNCPNIGKIFMFLNNNPDFTAHGYAVDSSRNDYRISLEGVEIKRPCTEKEWDEFKKLFGGADELRGSYDTPLYCWYD